MADAYVVGNSPYYQVITAMAQEAGLTVKLSFNGQYDEHLPKAQGNVLIVETHNGVPIVDLALLERFFPGASQALHDPRGVARSGYTTIVLLEFSRQLAGLV